MERHGNARGIQCVLCGWPASSSGCSRPAVSVTPHPRSRCPAKGDASIVPPPVMDRHSIPSDFYPAPADRRTDLCFTPALRATDSSAPPRTGNPGSDEAPTTFPQCKLQLNKRNGTRLSSPAEPSGGRPGLTLRARATASVSVCLPSPRSTLMLMLT